MKDCNRFIKLLDTDPNNPFIEQHKKSCADCADYYEDWNAIGTYKSPSEGDEFLNCFLSVLKVKAKLPAETLQTSLEDLSYTLSQNQEHPSNYETENCVKQVKISLAELMKNTIPLSLEEKALIEGELIQMRETVQEAYLKRELEKVFNDLLEDKNSVKKLNKYKNEFISKITTRHFWEHFWKELKKIDLETLAKLFPDITYNIDGSPCALLYSVIEHLYHFAICRLLSTIIADIPTTNREEKILSIIDYLDINRLLEGANRELFFDFLAEEYRLYLKQEAIEKQKMKDTSA